MNSDHFERMNIALAAEARSEHLSHKVGALICGTDQNGKAFECVRHNFWPDALAKQVGTDQKLGNSSTTVHAEVAAILESPNTEDADIYVTNAPCPNCAKMIVEAGIKRVFIDAHTHKNSELAKKMKPFFENVSKLIFKKAGVEVFEMDVTEKRKEILVERKVCPDVEAQDSVQINPIQDTEITEELYKRHLKVEEKNIPYAACIARDQSKVFYVSAHTSATTGLSDQDAQTIRSFQDKYAATLQPLNRLLVNCKRQGLKIDGRFLFSSQTPTSREFVNMIGAGYSRLYIGDQSKCRDKWGRKALEQIVDKKLMEFC